MDNGRWQVLSIVPLYISITPLKCHVPFIGSNTRRDVFSVLHDSFLEFLAIKIWQCIMYRSSGLQILQEETESEYHVSLGTFRYKRANHTLLYLNIFTHNNIQVITSCSLDRTCVLLISWSDPWGWRGMWCFPSAWRLPPAPMIHRRNAWSRCIPWCTAGWGTPRYRCHPNPVVNTTETTVSQNGGKML